MLNLSEKEQFSILIVDDEPKNIQLLGNILKEEGYLCEYTTNGEEALDWITSQPFEKANDHCQQHSFGSPLRLKEALIDVDGTIDIIHNRYR